MTMAVSMACLATAVEQKRRAIDSKVAQFLAI